VVPIYEGYAIPHAITPYPVNGKTLTDYMLQLMELKSPGNQLNTREYAEWFKCTIGEVALDPDAKLKEYKENPSNEYYILPGGTKVQYNLKEEKILCPEMLFSSKDSDAKGIQYVTNEAITRCDNDIKKELFRNIVLAGGSTMFKGM